MRNQVRVCFPFIGDSIGGAHMSALLLIEGLDRSRYEPMIVVHEEGPLSDHLGVRGIPFELLPLPVYAGEVPRVLSIAVAIIRNMPRLVGFLKREDIDIVHGNDLRVNLTWSAAAKIAGRSAVWHQRALPYSRSPLWRTIGVLSDHVIHVSSASARAMPSTRRTPVSTVPNPVAISRTAPLRESAKAAIAREFGFDPDATIIGFVGRLVEIKRPDIFVAAAASLARRAPACKSAFIVVGYDEDRMAPKLREQARRMGIDGRLFFTGFRHPIEDWIAGMDLLMATSERDSFGRTLIEGMAVGTPVIAARAGGHLDIVEHERTGLLVPPNEPAAFASAAHRILTDTDFSGKLIEEARKCAIGRYSVSNHAARIMSIYGGLP